MLILQKKKGLQFVELIGVLKIIIILKLVQVEQLKRQKVLETVI